MRADEPIEWINGEMTGRLGSKCKSTQKVVPRTLRAAMIVNRKGDISEQSAMALMN